MGGVVAVVQRQCDRRANLAPAALREAAGDEVLADDVDLRVVEGARRVPDRAPLVLVVGPEAEAALVLPGPETAALAC